MRQNNHHLEILLKDSHEVQDYLRVILESLNYSKDSIIRYTFLLEEALIRWREVFPPDSKLFLSCRKSAGDVRLSLSIEGEKTDPFRIQNGNPEEESFVKPEIERMKDLLLSGIGSEFRFSYKAGRNTILGTFPQKNVEDALFKKNLLLLTIPFVLQTLLTSIANYTDAFMLSFLDTSSMSAVSLSTEFCSIFNLLMISVTGALVALVSQLWGKRDRESIRCISGLAMKTALMIACLFFIIAFFFPGPVMSFFTDVEAVKIAGIQYLRIIAPSFFFIAIYTVLSGCFNIMGNAGTALKIGIFGCILNVIANYIFIFGVPGIPSLGVKGAALATFVSQLSLCIGCLIYHQKMHVSSFCFFMKQPFRSNIRNMFFRQLAPISGSFMVWKAASIIIVRVYGHLGPDILAAYSVIVILDSLVGSVKAGMGKASGVLIGSSLGKNRLEEALRNSRRSIQLGSVICLVCMGIYYLCGFGLKFLPTDLSDTAKTCLDSMILVYGINLFFAGLNAILLDGGIRAGGDTKAVLIIDMAVMWGILVPLALLGENVLKIPVLLLALILKSDEIISFPAKLYRYRQKKWLRNLSVHE